MSASFVSMRQESVNYREIPTFRSLPDEQGNLPKTLCQHHDVVHPRTHKPVYYRGGSHKYPCSPMQELLPVSVRLMRLGFTSISWNEETALMQ